MLFDWFNSEKPNVYLGSLAVVNDSNISKIESFFSISGNSLQDHMRKKLEEIFASTVFLTLMNRRNLTLAWMSL
ncbi:hypothetical protein KUC14_21220 [Alteromonas sp. KC14]|nr:hypothetical protein KUC14_21220 [Alteromonas sp. KC14]